jgi:hypothetical protein
MEERKNNAGQSMGIAALIIAILTFVMAAIPCIGILAIIPGTIAIILAAVGLSQAAGHEAPRGMLIAGLIIAAVAVVISFSQIFVAGKLAKNADKWPDQIQNIIKDVEENVVKELDDSNVSIKIESDGEKIEINTSSDKKELEEKLEDLEEGNIPGNDSLPKAK